VYIKNGKIKMLINNRPRILVENKLVKIEEFTDIQEVVHDGTLSAEYTLFNFAKRAKETVDRLYKVITRLETSLTDVDTIRQLVSYPVNLRFEYYMAFTKVVMKLVDYMEKIHFIVADQVKFNAIKDRLKELSTPLVEGEVKKDIIEEGSKEVGNVLVLMKNEMARRNKRR
jgi:hypothetical protein